LFALTCYLQQAARTGWQREGHPMSFLYRRMMKQLGVVQTHPVSIRHDIQVRMPDGAVLLTDLYLGSAAPAAPVIMIRSPYGKGVSFAASSAYPLASQGFNVVMQSCRGTFGSSGKFDPHHDEHRDGLATIEWIKQQPWYGGSMATFGMSYLGYTQWAVAATAGPEVKAMAMQVTLSDFSQMTYSGNSFALENAFTWTHMVSKMKKQRLFMLRFILFHLLGIRMISKQQWRMLPLSSLDERIIGERVGFWQDWMQHDSADDPWWAPMGFRSSIGAIRRPITMVAGWFDIFLPWQMRDFQSLCEAGCESRITIGPWRHTDMDLGRTGIHDAIDWFKRHLLGTQTATMPKRVKLYVMGSNEWRYFDAWPPTEAVVEQWYLQPQHQLLDKVPPDSQPDQYRYDPADPTPSIGGPTLETTPFCVDNAELEARADVITYTSGPLAQHRDLIGALAAELYVSSSAPSADLFVRLCDVDAHGVSRNICDGLQRVRFASPQVPQGVRVDLWPTAYRLAQGHRLRVQISSGAFPRWARNPGEIEPLSQASRLISSTQGIHHSPSYPSRIDLPFVAGASAS
jgi:putative CocE/NonD family hydrolase